MYGIIFVIMTNVVTSTNNDSQL